MSNSAVLVIGGGLTGLQAAVELSAAGAQAIVLERGPIIGGKRAAWLSGEKELDPRLARAHSDEGIEILTHATLQSITGKAGAFSATISQGTGFVTGDCTRCNHCVPVCPQITANEYDVGLTYRKAIHSPLADAWPEAYVIDINTCLNVPPNYLPCQRCVEVCEDNAIHFDLPQRSSCERQVVAVIVATGFATDSSEEKQALAEFGYGTHADILSSTELQRLLEDPGPSGGFAIRPSDEAYPDSVLLVLTRVSAEACWIMSNQLRRLARQDIDKLALLVLAASTEEETLQPLLEAASECGVDGHCGNWIGVETDSQGRLQVRYAQLPAGAAQQYCCELLVLSSEIEPDAAVGQLASLMDLELNEQGYPGATRDELSTTREGIFIAGGALGTVGIEASAEQARRAVHGALAYLPKTEEAAVPGSSQPDWEQLPEQVQRTYLEQMLRSLMELGERGKP